MDPTDRTITSAEACVHLLRDRRVAVVPYQDRYTSLAQRLGLDFEAILFAFAHLPLALNGSRHVEKRKSVAAHLARRKAALAENLPGAVRAHLVGLAAPGQIELVRQAIIPLVDAALAPLFDCPLDLPPDSLVSRLFSANIGVRKRQRLEAELGQLRARFVAADPAADAETIGTLLSLAILGRDSLIGSVALSLHAVLTENAGRRLCDIAFPEALIRTGVPYVDRIAREDIALEGADIRAGNSIRVQLASLAASERLEDLERLFGAGAHTCLGRPLALDLWRAIGAYLASVPTTVTPLAFSLRKDDVFSFPEEFQVAVR